MDLFIYLWMDWFKTTSDALILFFLFRYFIMRDELEVATVTRSIAEAPSFAAFPLFRLWMD